MAPYFNPRDYCQCICQDYSTGGCNRCGKMMSLSIASGSGVTDSQGDVRHRKKHQYTAPLKSRDRGWER